MFRLWIGSLSLPRLWFAQVLFSGAIFLTVHGECEAEGVSGPDGSLPQVLTTFLPIHSWTLQVAGEYARVENLLPGPVSPHEFHFTPKDLKRIQEADLLIVNGLGMEPWVEGVLRSLGEGNAPKVVEASQGLQAEHLIRGMHGHHAVEPLDEGVPGHDHRGVNPHTWLDPWLAAHGVTNILRALQETDPKHSAGYQQNAGRYIQRLQQLDRDLESALQEVRNQPFVTYHNAFPYLVRRYDLRLVGVVETQPSMNPSPRELMRLIKGIREEKVQVLFTEPQSNERLARRLAEDMNLKLAELPTLETGKLGREAYEEGMRRIQEVLLQNLKE